MSLGLCPVYLSTKVAGILPTLQAVLLPAWWDDVTARSAEGSELTCRWSTDSRVGMVRMAAPYLANLPVHMVSETCDSPGVRARNLSGLSRTSQHHIKHDPVLVYGAPHPGRDTAEGHTQLVRRPQGRGPGTAALQPSAVNVDGPCPRCRGAPPYRAPEAVPARPRPSGDPATLLGDGDRKPRAAGLAPVTGHHQTGSRAQIPPHRPSGPLLFGFTLQP